jgi:hypothetical protein
VIQAPCVTDSAAALLSELREFFSEQARRGKGRCVVSQVLRVQKGVAKTGSKEAKYLATEAKNSTTSDPKVEKVLEHWCTTFNLVKAHTPTRVATVQMALAAGLTVEQCCAWIDHVGANPWVIQRGPGADITTLFRPVNLRRACKFLGIPVPEAKETWLTPFANIFARRYPTATFPYGMAARSLSAAVRQHGGEYAQQEFAAYVDRTVVEYFSFPKFVMGLGTWASGRKAQLMPSNKPLTVTVE